MIRRVAPVLRDPSGLETRRLYVPNPYGREIIRAWSPRACFMPLSGASQQDVADIETAVGTDADAAAQGGSVHAKLKELRTLVDDLETRIGVPAGSLTALVDDLETRLGTPASGTVASQIGSDADASSATGSVHAKLKDLKANPAAVINSIQRGTIAMATSGATSATATITSVNTAKSFMSHGGMSSPIGSAADIGAALVRLTLTNGTTVTADRGANGTSVTVGFEVVEYK